MAVELLAVGTGAASSADLVVGAGTPVTVALKGYTDNGARVNIALKDDDGDYHHQGALTGASPSTVIAGPGTYRFTRPASSSACGAFSG